MEVKQTNKVVRFINKLNIRYRKFLRVLIFLSITGGYLVINRYYNIDSVYIVIGVIFAIQYRKK